MSITGGSDEFEELSSIDSIDLEELKEIVFKMLSENNLTAYRVSCPEHDETFIHVDGEPE